MSPRYYTLRVKTSDSSATAFCLSASDDDDAVGRALCVIRKFDLVWDQPAFEVQRADGTLLRGITRGDRPTEG